MADFIGTLYYWLWHDLLKLPKQITYLIIENMQRHELAWSLTGSILLASGWTLIVHLIVTR